LAESQLHRAVLGSTQQLARREMRRPHLGNDEYVVARHARSAQPLAHLTLVVVHLGGVDVAIAEPKRLLHNACTRAPAQIPGAEPQQRNACALRLDEFHLHLTAPRIRPERTSGTWRGAPSHARCNRSSWAKPSFPGSSPSRTRMSCLGFRSRNAASRAPWLAAPRRDAGPAAGRSR